MSSPLTPEERQAPIGKDGHLKGLIPAPVEPRSKPPSTPLELVMKNGIPKNAEKRNQLRDELYALLASAEDAKESALIARQIQRVWLTSGSETVTVLMARATVALRAKKYDISLKLLDNVVELAPDDAEAWNRRAYVQYSMKNYRAAVGDLRRALALDPNHFKALDGLGAIFLQLGDDAKALAVFEQLREVNPYWPNLEKTYQHLKEKVHGRGI